MSRTKAAEGQLRQSKRWRGSPLFQLRCRSVPQQMRLKHEAHPSQQKLLFVMVGEAKQQLPCMKK